MRRSKPTKRVIPGDVRYNSVLVTGFVNRMMRRGKRSTGTRVVYGAFDLITARAKRDPLEVFEQAIKNASPMLEVKPRRVGGALPEPPAVDVRRSHPHRRAVAGVGQHANVLVDQRVDGHLWRLGRVAILGRA